MKDAINVPDPGEKVRVLNLLQMYENGALTIKNQRLSAIALMCKTVLDIRKYNRKLICALDSRKWRTFDNGEFLPTIGKSILLRDEHGKDVHEKDVHVEHVVLSEEQLEHFLEYPDKLYWMYDIEERL